MSTTVTIEMIDLECWCGTPFSAPRGMYNQQRKQEGRSGGRMNSDPIYCPHGHRVWYGPDAKYEQLRERAEAAEREREAAERRATRVRAQLDQTEASLRATKGANTKLKKRVAAGVCPCCHRTFANVARHMAGQHPGFAS